MKNTLLALSLLIFTLCASAQNVGVGTNTPTTTLDVKGGFRIQPLYLTGSGTSIIIPDNQSNINLAGSFTGSFAATINNPQDGQKLIIDNNSSQIGILNGSVNILKGLNEFVHSDGEWKQLNTNNWSLNGNYNTDPATQFIGTGDASDVSIRRNSLEKLKLVNEGLQIRESNTLEFGAGISGKQVDNGKIGYNSFGEANTLSIVGGGVSPTGLDRRIKMWADLGTDFTGGATFNKSVQINNNQFSMLSLVNSNALAAGSTHRISFGGTNYTTGLITITGTSSNTARMGFSTGYSFTGGPTNLLERLTISNNGNIGVGRIDPIAKLDVAGDINTTGLIKVSNVSGTAGQVLTSNGPAAPTWSNSSFNNDIRFGVTIASNSTTGTPLLFNQVYNTNPSLVTIKPGSSAPNDNGEITVVKAGLYRLNGSIGFKFTCASLPYQQPSVNISVIANNFTYQVADFLEMPRLALGPYNTNFYYGVVKEFSYDIYMEANTKIRIGNSVNFTSSDVIVNYRNGSFSGYLISE